MFLFNESFSSVSSCESDADVTDTDDDVIVGEVVSDALEKNDIKEKEVDSLEGCQIYMSYFYLLPSPLTINSVNIILLKIGFFINTVSVASCRLIFYGLASVFASYDFTAQFK